MRSQIEGSGPDDRSGPPVPGEARPATGAFPRPAGSPAVLGDQAGPYRRPSVRYERLAERTGERPAPEWPEWTGPTVETAFPPPWPPGRADTPGERPGTVECVCGRVCVCRVPDGVVRSVASFVAEWHPTAVVDRSPAAEQAEDATVCRCGQAFCGYRILARTMRRGGAYIRA